MAKRENYNSENCNSEPWTRPGHDREISAPSHSPYQGFSHSSYAPQLDEHGYPLSGSRPAYSDEYLGASRSSGYRSLEERPNNPRGAGPVQPIGQPYRDESLERNRILYMSNMPRGPSSLAPHDSFEYMNQPVAQPSRVPSTFQRPYPPPDGIMGYTVRSPPGLSIRNSYPDLEAPPSQDPMDMEYTIPRDRLDYPNERIASREAAMVAIIPGLGPGPGQGLGPNIDDRHSKRYRGGRSEFEGDVQYLDQRVINQAEERDLNYEPTHLNHREQNDILSQVNRRLSQCAFDFIAMYQFPIPLEPGKPKVCVATDKAWTEWVFLLKRLATKRRIPSKAIYDGQIKHLTTILDNSMETRHATKPQPRPLKDDRNVLQQISAGIQVGKMLKDAATMKFLDTLYLQTEMVIQDRINNGSTSR